MDYYYTLLTIYMVFSFATCVVATYCLPKYKHTPLILAPVILWLSFVTESSGILYSEYIRIANGWIFNIYGFLFFLLFFIMLHNFIKAKRSQTITKAIIISVLTARSIRFFMLDSFNDRMIFIDALELVALIIIIAIFLREFLKSNESFNFKHHPEFFFIGGYLIFHLVYTPLNVAYDMKLRLFSGTFYVFLKSIQFYVLLAMNGFFIFGFLWTKKME